MVLNASQSSKLIIYFFSTCIILLFLFNFDQTMSPDVYQGPWGGSNCRDSLAQTLRSCDCPQGIHIYVYRIAGNFRWCKYRGITCQPFRRNFRGFNFRIFSTWRPHPHRRGCLIRRVKKVPYTEPSTSIMVESAFSIEAMVRGYHINFTEISGPP